MVGFSFVFQRIWGIWGFSEISRLYNLLNSLDSGFPVKRPLFRTCLTKKGSMVGRLSSSYDAHAGPRLLLASQAQAHQAHMTTPPGPPVGCRFIGIQDMEAGGCFTSAAPILFVRFCAVRQPTISVAGPAELRGEKIFYFS